MDEWKLLPVEPTDRMVDAFENAMEGANTHIRNFPAAYAAMLAAAPKAPSGQQAEPTDEQIDALFDSHGYGVSMVALSRKSYRDEARTILALAGQQSERPAPVGEPSELAEGLKHCLRYVNGEGCIEMHADFAAKIIAYLAASQAERPAGREDVAARPREPVPELESLETGEGDAVAPFKCMRSGTIAPRCGVGCREAMQKGIKG
jgi:hypothetical protein